MARPRWRPDRCLIAAGAALAVALAVFWGRGGAEPYRETLYVFGTLVEIIIHDEKADAARDATRAVSALFDRLHRDWHAWEPGGALAALNAAIAEGRRASVSPALEAILRDAQSYAALSGGLFEPGIGGLIAAWGFHADQPPEGPPPTDAAIARWVDAAPSIADLRFGAGEAWSTNPALRIDLGAVGKGAALAQAADLLEARGVKNAVLNAGGDLVVRGDAGGRPWRIAIRDPFAWGAVASLELAPGEALFTSGNYERYLEQDGERLSHILDPRTGRPAPDIISASVLHEDAALADAAATALSVAGRSGWRNIAARMGVNYAVLVDRNNRLWTTPAMAQRLTLEQDRQATIFDGDRVIGH